MVTEHFREISRGVLQALWLAVYWYYTEQAGTMEKGAGKRAVAILLTCLCLAAAVWLPGWVAWLAVCGVMILFDLFFDEEPFSRQWCRILLPGLVLAAGALLPEQAVFLFHGGVLYLFLLLLSGKRESLHPGNGILTGLSFGLIGVFLWLIGEGGRLETDPAMRGGLLWGGALLELLLFFTVEGTLFFYQRGFVFRTEQFRNELMEHSYGEIRDVYMDMRGWRHDYHNHMQVIKAQLAVENYEGVETYLDQLERELDRVDTLVKSGNLMTDAILNSKLTLARRHEIRIDCKARLPERLSLEDVDLCVILGNLLDNAIEACGQVEKEDRFLRIYLAVRKGQFYLSVQNSARAETDFDQRNYISRKRGNHGLGMKRVKAAVDKYQGYLNLANEPGIFAAEVTLPLSDFS